MKFLKKTTSSPTRGAKGRKTPIVIIEFIENRGKHSENLYPANKRGRSVPDLGSSRGFGKCRRGRKRG